MLLRLLGRIMSKSRKTTRIHQHQKRFGDIVGGVRFCLYDSKDGSDAITSSGADDESKTQQQLKKRKKKQPKYDLSSTFLGSRRFDVAPGNRKRSSRDANLGLGGGMSVSATDSGSSKKRKKSLGSRRIWTVSILRDEPC